jgi:preprotein translocase subunit YajC
MDGALLEGQPLNAFFAQPSPAPGREGSAPPPQTAQGAPAPAGEGAPPQAPGGTFMLLLPLLLVVMMFITMRGQNKKQKQLESTLKAGDTVITSAGLIGKVTELNERTARLEIAPGVNVRILKSAISGVEGGETKDPTKEKAQEKKA